MMMKSKMGFTLVELLAVIVILGIILTIATTSVIKNINDSKEKVKYTAAKEIVEMAEVYFANNGINDNDCINVEDMIPNYLETDVTNPLTGENRTDENTLVDQQVCKANVLKQEDYVPKNDEVYCFDGFVYKLNSSADVSSCDAVPTTTTTTTTTSKTTTPNSTTTTKKQATIRCYQNGIQKTTFAPNTEFYCSIGLLISGVDYEANAKIVSAKGYPQYESTKAVLKYSGTGTVTILAYKEGYQITPATIKIKSSSSGSSGSSSSGNNGDSCLVEGTKIKTIEGYKNIEDIDYDDLLETWSYDLGKIVYEYPIWIEKKSESDSYQETTFSDGTVLKTVGFHGIYNYDLNKFVSVDDKENFKVGTTVAKIENGKLKKVTVVKIENKKEKVNYYHVESTRYYNVIANDLLTTDGYVDLSNIYTFNSNVTWKNKNEVLLNKDNLYTYSDFKENIPYYLYSGLRMQEARYLVNKGIISKESLIEILNNTMLNSDITKKPIIKNENRYWMVTLSTDNLTEKNKQSFLKKEGDVYILPKDNNVKYWYNSSDNKYYKPGSKVKVYHGMHFTKIEK